MFSHPFLLMLLPLCPNAIDEAPKLKVDCFGSLDNTDSIDEIIRSVLIIFFGIPGANLKSGTVWAATKRTFMVCEIGASVNS